MNEPAASPDQRGKACVRKRTRSAAGSAALVILALLVQPSLDLAELRSLGRDLFAEHARGEEDAAEQYARLNDRPDPSLPDAIDPQSSKREDAGKTPKPKTAKPSIANNSSGFWAKRSSNHT